MIYHSTRDEKLTAAPTRAVLEGIAPDGGLYVCDPGKLDFDWQGTLQKDTMSMAADILGCTAAGLSGYERTGAGQLCWKIRQR